MMVTGSAESATAVAVSTLSKRFAVRRGWAETVRHPWSGPRVTALDRVDLTVRRGECFGLLGQNGAGKTTLFKILATLIEPDEGAAAVLGHDTVSAGAAVRRSLAPVIANERSLYWRLSARDNLSLFAALLGLDRQEGSSRIAAVLETVALADTSQMVALYSTGMKQRLLIARALLSRPAVLLLDEPTRSLDPISAEEFRRFLRNDLLHRGETTVLLATHDAEEVRDLCDRVAILDHGRILTTGSTAELMERYGRPHYRVWTTQPRHPLLVELSRNGGPGTRREPAAPATRPFAEGQTADHAGAPAPGPGWSAVDVLVPGGLAGAEDTLARLIGGGVPVARFEKVDLSLADLLRHVVSAHPPVPHA